MPHSNRDPVARMAAAAPWAAARKGSSSSSRDDAPNAPRFEPKADAPKAARFAALDDDILDEERPVKVHQDPNVDTAPDAVRQPVIQAAPAKPKAQAKKAKAIVGAAAPRVHQDDLDEDEVLPAPPPRGGKQTRPHDQLLMRSLPQWLREKVLSEEHNFASEDELLEWLRKVTAQRPKEKAEARRKRTNAERFALDLPPLPPQMKNRKKKPGDEAREEARERRMQLEELRAYAELEAFRQGTDPDEAIARVRLPSRAEQEKEDAAQTALDEALRYETLDVLPDDVYEALRTTLKDYKAHSGPRDPKPVVFKPLDDAEQTHKRPVKDRVVQDEEIKVKAPGLFDDEDESPRDPKPVVFRPPRDDSNLFADEFDAPDAVAPKRRPPIQDDVYDAPDAVAPKRRPIIQDDIVEASDRKAPIQDEVFAPPERRPIIQDEVDEAEERRPALQDDVVAPQRKLPIQDDVFVPEDDDLQFPDEFLMPKPPKAPLFRPAPAKAQPLPAAEPRLDQPVLENLDSGEDDDVMAAAPRAGARVQKPLKAEEDEEEGIVGPAPAAMRGGSTDDDDDGKLGAPAAPVVGAKAGKKLPPALRAPARKAAVDEGDDVDASPNAPAAAGVPEVGAHFVKAMQDALGEEGWQHFLAALVSDGHIGTNGAAPAPAVAPAPVNAAPAVGGRPLPGVEHQKKVKVVETEADAYEADLARQKAPKFPRGDAMAAAIAVEEEEEA